MDALHRRVQGIDVLAQHLVRDLVLVQDVVVHERAGRGGAEQEAEQSVFGDVLSVR